MMLTASAESILIGDPLTLTATIPVRSFLGTRAGDSPLTITGPTLVSEGFVWFYEGTRTLGQPVAILAGREAVLTLPRLGRGEHVIRAEYVPTVLTEEPAVSNNVTVTVSVPAIPDAVADLGEVGRLLDGDWNGSVNWSPRISVVCIGTDGSRWDWLHGPMKASRRAIRGLGTARIKAQTSEAAALDGEELEGWKYETRELAFTLRPTTRDLFTHRAFWSSLRYREGDGTSGAYVTLEVDDGWGRVVTIRARKISDDEVQPELDPHVLSQAFTVVLQADSPLYQGQEIVRPLAVYNPAGQPSFLADEPGEAPLTITSSGAVAPQQITNPGDVKAWPRFVVQGVAGGIVEGYDFTVGGEHVTGTTVVLPGQRLVIDTDPRVQAATLYASAADTVGEDASDELVAADFAAIPAGSSRIVAGTIFGPSSTYVAFHPRYEAAL